MQYNPFTKDRDFHQDEVPSPQTEPNILTISIRTLTRAGRFMKGRDVLRSAFKAVTELADCCIGAKAEADEARRARAAANFIMAYPSS
jgi:hypothetical protein